MILLPSSNLWNQFTMTMATTTTSTPAEGQSTSNSASTTTTFLTGMFVGIGIATMWPNWFPNLEYHRRNMFVQLMNTFPPSSPKETTEYKRIQDKVDVFSLTAEMYSMVLPNWIDRNKHMNNARYIYELNFVRRQFFQKLQLIPLLNSYQCNLILQSQSIRYRKDLKLWQMFIIEIRIIDWNDADASFYLESKFLDAKTKFVHAIHYAKYRVVLSTTSPATSPLKQKTSSSEKKTVPTPSELLRELKLIDDDDLRTARTASIDSMRSVEPEIVLPQDEATEKEELELLHQTKEKLHVKNSNNHSFIVFWETANQISSQQLNPAKR